MTKPVEIWLMYKCNVITLYKQNFDFALEISFLFVRTSWFNWTCLVSARLEDGVIVLALGTIEHTQ